MTVTTWRWWNIYIKPTTTYRLQRDVISCKEVHDLSLEWQTKWRPMSSPGWMSLYDQFLQPVYILIFIFSLPFASSVLACSSHTVHHSLCSDPTQKLHKHFTGFILSAGATLARVRSDSNLQHWHIGHTTDMWSNLTGHVPHLSIEVTSSSATAH